MPVWAASVAVHGGGLVAVGHWGRFAPWREDKDCQRLLVTILKTQEDCSGWDANEAKEQEQRIKVVTLQMGKIIQRHM